MTTPCAGALRAALGRWRPPGLAAHPSHDVPPPGPPPTVPTTEPIPPEIEEPPTPIHNPGPIEDPGLPTPITVSDRSDH